MASGGNAGTTVSIDSRVEKLENVMVSMVYELDNNRKRYADLVSALHTIAEKIRQIDGKVNGHDKLAGDVRELKEIILRAESRHNSSMEGSRKPDNGPQGPMYGQPQGKSVSFAQPPDLKDVNQIISGWSSGQAEHPPIPPATPHPPSNYTTPYHSIEASNNHLSTMIPTNNQLPPAGPVRMEQDRTSTSFSPGTLFPPTNSGNNPGQPSVTHNPAFSTNQPGSHNPTFYIGQAGMHSPLPTPHQPVMDQRVQQFPTDNYSQSALPQPQFNQTNLTNVTGTTHQPRVTPVQSPGLPDTLFLPANGGRNNPGGRTVGEHPSLPGAQQTGPSAIPRPQPIVPFATSPVAPPLMQPTVNHDNQPSQPVHIPPAALVSPQSPPAGPAKPSNNDVNDLMRLITQNG